MKKPADSNMMACLQCHGPMSYDVGSRSKRWFFGVLGSRAVLCSPTCRDRWDDEQPRLGGEV